MHTFQSKFMLGDKVFIDGSTAIVATVTGIAFYADRPQAQVSWFNNGDLKEVWIYIGRLTLAD